MMRLPKLLFTAVGILSLLLVFNDSYAQVALRVKGSVFDSKDNLPLSGATIQQMGSNNKIIADSTGLFEITVPRHSKLLITMTGYKSVVVAASATVSVPMESRVAALDDVVVVGYGTQKKELLTASIATMKVTEADDEIPTTMLGNLLAGRMAGVTVTTPNGIPGQSAPGITIRTPTSFNAQPVLYVIDGKIMGSGDFNNLSPNEVASISVLKDAASSAVYGSRAAGGVIIVTTKKGFSGRARVSYSFNSGTDTRTKNVPLTSAVQAGELYQEINPTSDPAGWAWTPSDIAYFQNINHGWGYDQLDAVWRNPSTATQNLSVSGGSDKVQYFIGGSYVKQNGFLKDLSYDKYNLRANVTANVTKNLQVFAGLTLNNNLTYSTTNTAVGSTSGIYTKLLVWQPDQPVFTNTGKPIDYGWIANVGAETDGTGGYINSAWLKPVINLRATYQVPFLPGLSASAAYSKSYTDSRTKTFETQYNMYVMQKQGLHIISTNDTGIVSTKLSSQVNPSFMQEDVLWSEDKQIDLQLNYTRTFGTKNHLKGWLIYERYLESGSGVSAGVRGFPVYTTPQWWAASTNTNNDQYVSNSTTYSEDTTGRKSWIGQFFYDYDEKYLASVAYRYDGSMNFAPNERWGLFPTASVGWVISKESFFKAKGIDLLKVRASMGLIGNDAVGGWQWQTSYVAGTNYYLGATPSTDVGITYGGVVNPNLTWEKSLNKNVGVDINFLKHFGATVDYWFTHTYDILGTRIETTPPSFSLTLPAVNYAIMNAQGLDLSLGYSNRAGKVNYYTGITASYGYARWIQRDVNATYDYQNYNGRTTTYITGYKVAGMIRTPADLAKLQGNMPNYKFNGYAPAVGQLIYKDLNSSAGVGKPDGLIDNYDITVLRKNNDPIVFGWNLGAEWKGISLTANFNGMLREWKSYNDLTGGVEWNRMWNKWYTDSWSTSNPNATLPKRYSANDATGTVNNSGSDFWWKNANFIRLKSLNLAYTIPAKWYKKLNVEKMQAYFSGSNLFIISKFNKDYYDPELSSGTAFPIMRSYNFGFNVTL